MLSKPIHYFQIRPSSHSCYIYIILCACWWIVLTKENLIKSRLQTKIGKVLNKQHFSPCFLLHPLFLLFWILKKISAEAAFKIIEFFTSGQHLCHYVKKMSCTLTFSSCWLSFFCSSWLTLLLFFSYFSPLFFTQFEWVTTVKQNASNGMIWKEFSFCPLYNKNTICVSWSNVNSYFYLTYLAM